MDLTVIIPLVALLLVVIGLRGLWRCWSEMDRRSSQLYSIRNEQIARVSRRASALVVAGTCILVASVGFDLDAADEPEIAAPE